MSLASPKVSRVRTSENKGMETVPFSYLTYNRFRSRYQGEFKMGLASAVEMGLKEAYSVVTVTLCMNSVCQ